MLTYQNSSANIVLSTKCGVKGGDEMNAQEIGKRLRELRGERTITEVAEALNISQSTISMWETGERIPRDEMKVKLSLYYGKSIEEIFFN